MCKVISICLQKGGVGKTTTALNLSATLGFKHKRVLLIDLDSQGNATYASGIDSPDLTITDVLGEDCAIEEAIRHCKYYDIISADEYLTNVEMSEGIENTLLKKAISKIKKDYDFIIIDTPPALGNLISNALVASDYVIIPTEPRQFAIEGIKLLYKTIHTVQDNANKGLKVLGILLIKYNNRTILNRDLKDNIDAIARQMNTVVFNATIREGVAVAEAQTVRQPLIDYAKNSKPNIDYKGFTSEVLERIGA